jgi:hypothetical protein
MKPRSYVGDGNRALYLVVIALTILGTLVAMSAIWNGH